MNTQDEPAMKKKCCGGCRAGIDGHAPCRKRATKTEANNKEIVEAGNAPMSLPEGMPDPLPG